MKEIKAPEYFAYHDFFVFLAGSIEQDTAEKWQDKICRHLSDESVDITVLNPRRDDWDDSWDCSIDNPEFKRQVNWELDGLNTADLIVFYFDPSTKSPITLLELGIHARAHNVVVCCPDGFWRKGNVDIVCQRYNIPQVKTLEDLTLAIIEIYWKH